MPRAAIVAAGLVAVLSAALPEPASAQRQPATGLVTLQPDPGAR